MRLFFVITCQNVFNVWPKTTLLLVWPRDAKRLDIPGRQFHSWLLPFYSLPGSHHHSSKLQTTLCHHLCKPQRLSIELRMKSKLPTMSHKVLHNLIPLASGLYPQLRVWQDHLSAYALISKVGIFLAHRRGSVPLYSACLLCEIFWPFQRQVSYLWSSCFLNLPGYLYLYPFFWHL